MVSLAQLQTSLAGRYRPEREIARGGMAVVFLAFDLRHERPVAIKVLPPALSEALGRDRFLREIQVAARLTHPHILAVHDSGEVDGVLFYVMPYIQGESLRARLDREGQLSVPDVLRITSQIADALDYAHREGVIHRDIKPENVLLSGGHALVADFGIARPARTEKSGTMTTEGLIIGTPAYMSPEQVMGRVVDRRSDIYSLGCVIYEMLAGHTPFSGDGDAMLARHLSDQVPPLRTVRPAIPAAFEAELERALRKAPADRFDSATELADALERASRSADGGAPAAAAGPPSIRSLVVLPLENLGGDPQEEFFADGMTEALITHLAKIRSLRVISRSSAMRYKRASRPLPEIARELRVDAVLEGSVVRSGGRVRLTAQLLDAASDTHLWAESYERALTDVLELQRDLAESIAAEIRVQLSPQERTRLADARRVVPEAYDAFLRGRHFINKRTEAGIRSAIEQFQKALELDPTYALACSGLSHCFILLGEYSLAPPDQAFPRARAWALRALEIDPLLSPAQIALAYVMVLTYADPHEAEKEFLKGLEIDPSSSVAHQWYGRQLIWTGRFEEAVASQRRALELDPLSPILHAEVGYSLIIAGKPTEAIRTLEQAIAFEPDFAVAHLNLGIACALAGQFDRAVSECGRATALSSVGYYRAFLGFAYAKAGRKDDAIRVADQMVAESNHRYVSPYHVAVIHAGLDDYERTLEWLERAYAIRHSWMVRLWADPCFANMRDQPGVKRLVRLIGLPESWRDSSAVTRPA